MADRRERIRAGLYLALVGVVAIGIVTALFVVPFLRDRAQENRIKDLPIDSLGLTKQDADCDPRVREEVTLGSSDRHVETGDDLRYDSAPPAYGKHWPVPLAVSEYEVLFTDDRPPKERLVHSMEHGYTVIWYDAQIAGDPEQMGYLADIMAEFEVKDAVVAAPWTARDGARFPGGAHLALTHWSVEDGERGIWEYCAGVSGAVVKDFILDYPHEDAPEGGLS